MIHSTSAKLVHRPVPPVRTGLIVLALTLATTALPAVAQTPYHSDSSQVVHHYHYPQPLNAVAEHAHSKGAHGTTAGMRAAGQRLRGNKEAGLVHLPPGRGPLEQHHWPDSRASNVAVPGR